MQEHNRIIEKYKDFLPIKSKCHNFPQIIWIEAPVHDSFSNNLMRQKYNHTVDTASQFHENTWSLQLKKVWDSHNHSLFNKVENKYSIEGIKTYWEAVDKTIRYADTILLKKPFKPKTISSTYQDKHFDQNASGNAFSKCDYTPHTDKYHWKRQDDASSIRNHDTPRSSHSAYRHRSQTSTLRYHRSRSRSHSCNRINDYRCDGIDSSFHRPSSSSSFYC